MKEKRSHSLRVETELVGEEGADLPLALVGRTHLPELLAETFGLRGRQRPLVPVSRPEKVGTADAQQDGTRDVRTRRSRAHRQQ